MPDSATRPPMPRPREPRLTRRSSVIALVPHYRCEAWLPDCLESLVGQERPLQGIAVIHDGPEPPPVDIVRRFAGVTLLRAAENVGPYRLIQSAIAATLYDAYLFNDADDWSADARLAGLLGEAERTGAELIGSQEVRILCREGEAVRVAYPLDVNAALEAEPVAFPLLHPTSLVSRDLVMRIGGFAGGMRFSGDAEFLRRAAHVACVRNVPGYLYFRRKRDGALTTAEATGLRSPHRRLVHAQLHRRARDNADRVRRGAPPELAPLVYAPPVPLDHVTGPALRRAPDRRVRWTRGGDRRPARVHLPLADVARGTP